MRCCRGSSAPRHHPQDSWGTSFVRLTCAKRHINSEFFILNSAFCIHPTIAFLPCARDECRIQNFRISEFRIDVALPRTSYLDTLSPTLHHVRRSRSCSLHSNV